MVVQSILQAVLSKHLDKWFYGITRENIKAQVLKGRFVISNIGLRESIFVNSNMPYDLRHSYVEKIQLNINWTSNERVVSISINKIYALLAIKEEYDPDAVLLQLKKSAIKEHITKILNKKEDNQEESGEAGKRDGGISGFLKKLLDNVNISIKSIHLRFEDEVKGYSFGLRVYQIEIINVDERENPEFFNREKSQQNYINYRLAIDPLQVYFNPEETLFLCTKDYAEITNEMISMDNYRQGDGHSPSMFNGWGRAHFVYILTISVKGLLKRYIKRDSLDIPQFECNVTFKSIELNISDLQFHVLLTIIQSVTRYQEIMQGYNTRVEIVPRKERDGPEIISLMHMRTNKKERRVIGDMARGYLVWVFKEFRNELLRVKFVREVCAIKGDLTVEALFQSRKIEHIIRRVEIYRIKQWVEMCFEVKKKLNKDKSVFFPTSQTEQISRFNRYYLEQKQKLQAERQRQQLEKQRREKKKDKEFYFFVEEKEQIEREIVVKLSVKINQVELKVSKDNVFGVRVSTQNTEFDILKRRNNFKLVFAVKDLVADVFKLGFGQKYPTYVPILKKNVQVQRKGKKQNLIMLEFEKSPIGKPFVFSESKINFESIEITIYAQVFSNLYQIFFKPEKEKNESPKPQTVKKKKTNMKEEKDESFSGASFQQNIIEGFIESPWIIIPLSRTNDTSKDCWVVRLGDLNIETPPIQSSAKMDQRIFYERFFIQLKSFELKYFSSIDYFYIWLEYENSLHSLKSLPGFQNSKHIDIISPISCSVDLSVLKSHVSSIVKRTKEAFSARIKIEKVHIRLPKLLLDKLKQKVDVFGNEKSNQEFIETNAKNVVQQNTVQGLVTISNEKFKQITLYAILKGYFIYFFFKDSLDQILFTTDVRDTTIRLTSDHHTFINEGKSKKLKVQLRQNQKHGLWKKYLNQLFTKRDPINNRTLSQATEVRLFPEDSKQKTIEEQTKKNKKAANNEMFERIFESKKSFPDKQTSMKKKMQQEGTLLGLFFVMESLSIQLVDEKEDEFLYCLFEKTKFNYSNVEQKLITFSILEWKIVEKDKPEGKEGNKEASKKKNIPFLSCKRLFKEKQKRKQEYRDDKKDDDEEEEQNNFLEVAVMYNEESGQLSEVSIKVDQLYISWNIHIFNKILRFFFYSAEMNENLTPLTAKKSPLVVKFNMQKFYLYCFHDEQLIALLKLFYITIDYSQNRIEQKYIVNCERFEMDKYEDNDENRQVPMILCPHRLEKITKHMRRFKSGQFSENDSVKLDESMKPARGSQVAGSTNPMHLSYTVRKEETRQFPNIERLKRQFGDDLLVSQIVCTWSNFVVYFDMQQTIRLINYFISTILGTVAAKFKKKQYSDKYIFQTLNIKKMTTFDISLTNFTAIMTPHSRLDHFFQAKVQKVNFTKNIKDEQASFKPRPVKVVTKEGQVCLFHETMVFDITNINTFYRHKLSPPEKLAKSPFDVKVTYSKLNFSREYESILFKLADIDRTVRVGVKIQPGFRLEFQKIVFLTLLQIFYQNIKHRDGKADKFETPHPQPALKIYEIDLGTVELPMYEYVKTEEEVEQENKKKHLVFISKEALGNEKTRKQFQLIHAGSVRVLYENQGPNSQVELKLEQIHASGVVPVGKNNPYMGSSLLLKMDSGDGETFLKLVPSNLKLWVNLDNLNQVIEFTNYDSDYVSNKLMAKKKKDSIMTVNVFPDKCCAQVGELELFGDFYIVYMKDFKNAVKEDVLKYLFKGLDKARYSLDQSFIREQVSDKEIKVNGQNISVFINKKHIGVLKRLFFGRLEHSAKQTSRRYRRESVVIDGLSAMANILELKQLYQTYESHIKKAKDYEDKTFLLPFQQVPHKPKSEQQRLMQVQFQRSHVNLMRMLPQKNQQTITPFMSYLTIEFLIPRIVYWTYLKEQKIKIVDLGVKVLQYGGNLENNKILQFQGLKLEYREDKGKHSRQIEIFNAKDIRVNMRNMNEKLFALLAKELTSLSSLKAIEKTRNSQRKIYTQSVIQRALTQKEVQMDNSESIVNIEEDQMISTQQFYILFSNATSKSMAIIINNFQLNAHEKDSLQMKLHTKQARVLRCSGIKMLEFLDQSAKEKNFVTELGFRQDGSGPIVLRTMKEILFNSELELFSWCSIKYQAVPNGIKLEVFEPYSVINLTQRTFLVCLLDKRKKLLNPKWVAAEPNAEANFSGIDSMPYYLIIADSGSRADMGEINVDGYPLIEISSLPTNLAPKKIGPLAAYPSSLLEVMRWQSDSGSNRLKMVLFNRFRLQNNLPISVEANFTTVQGFKEAIIESSTGAPRGKLANLRIRVDGKTQIECDLHQACQALAPFFNEHKVKPKRRETKLMEHRLSANSREVSYRIVSWFRVGYLPKNMVSQPIQNNYITNPASLGAHKKISFTIENFIFLNQIVLCLSCSRVVKDSTVAGNQGKLTLGWYLGPFKEALSRRDNSAWMLPQPIDGLSFNLDNPKERVRSQTIQFSDITGKQGRSVWGRYLVSSFTQNISNETETLYMVEDLCVLENKTNHIIEACFMGEEERTRTAIYPNEKQNIQVIEGVPQGVGQYLELTAFCQSSKFTADSHLACTTCIELSPAKKQGEQKGAQTETLYWAINPCTSGMAKQHCKYESDLLRVTRKITVVGNICKYEFILESSPEEEKEKTNYGYRFVNNLPANYAVIVREEKGVVPEEKVASKEYEKYYQGAEGENEMLIPFEMDDDLPSLQMSHKKFSNNLSQRLDEVVELQRKDSKAKQLEIPRHKNTLSSRSKIVEYSINPQREVVLGLTNLKQAGHRSRMFTVEVYKVNCNLEFQQFFQVKVDGFEASSKHILIKEDQNRNRMVEFQAESDSHNSIKPGKKALQVMSKKVPGESMPKYKEYKVQLFTHKRADSALQLYIESKDLAAEHPLAGEPTDYERSLSVKLNEVSVTIEVTSNPADTLTLELKNLNMIQVQMPPASHLQTVDLQCDKFLVKVGKNSPIVQMLHANRHLLSLQASLEKVKMGSRIETLIVRLEPIEFNIREGIMFKVLSKVVELRNRYFFYGKKLDQSLEVDTNRDINLLNRQSQRSILMRNTQASHPTPKWKSRLEQKYLAQREATIKKQLKKWAPKMVVLKSLNIMQTRVYFSFSKDDYAQNKEQFVHDPIIKYFILIPAVSELKIKIPAIEMKDFQGTDKELSKAILNKIKGNIGSTVISSLSSLSVLDSPVAAIDGVFQYLEAILMINSS